VVGSDTGRDDMPHNDDLELQPAGSGPVPRLVSGRFGGVVLFVAVFLVFSTVSRIALTIKAWQLVSQDSSLIAAYAMGFGFDVLTGLLAAMPLVVWLALLPQSVFGSRAHRLLMLVSMWIGLFLISFISAAEWVFWDEIGVRFNFVAVDYLIYTNEVVGNIWQSYPMPAILIGLAVVASVAFWLLRRSGWVDAWLGSDTPAGRRWAVGGVLIGVPLLSVSLISQSDIPQLGGNNNNRELAKNGVFSFFAAYRSKELDYERFYRTIDDERALRLARALTGSAPSSFRSDDPWDFVHRVDNPKPERRLNVIQLTVESLSIHFLGAYTDPRGLTPNIDAVAEDGLLFPRCFATGTRTTRGMEALVLSIPPTPGRSIIHREGNEGLFTLGSVLRDRGYDTVFFYGGYSYFDNMKAFFSSNGYRVIDRDSVDADDVTFATAWGACDEDLYRWTVREADRLYERGTPFHFFVMTTSNHRPYTYPDGRIDIPSGSGRLGAVKYSDFAIGEFFRAARQRPWFDDTLFVIVADHSASSAGKAELEVRRYRVPLIMYAPGTIEPGQVLTQCSQIDVAPTVLALLGMSYDSTFFGRDILTMRPRAGRAYIGNYQKLGMLAQRTVVVLRPDGGHATLSCDLWGEDLEPIDRDDPELLEDTTAAYQAASLLFTHGLYTERAVRGR
ncbi:MAG: LTA synthase family protein, partial [Holophagae bacterium]